MKTLYYWYWLFEFVKLLSYDNYHLKSVKRVRTWFKGTLMKIWKSPYMFVFIQTQYPKNFAFLILRILELLAREVCKFPKK